MPCKWFSFISLLWLCSVACAHSDTTTTSATDKCATDAADDELGATDAHVLIQLQQLDGQLQSRATPGAHDPFEWRERLIDLNTKPEFEGHIYQFGVYEGGSMKVLHPIFPNAFMWGFDSFEGLPDVAGKENDVKQKNFQAGLYKSKVGPQELLAQLGGAEKADFIKGYFSDSLTPTLKDEKKMKPALYLDMDADLYSSTLDALDWAFQNQLVVPGTLIGYDDWWVNPCSKGGEDLSPLETGEGKAHREIADKYSVEFMCVAGPCMTEDGKANAWGPIFQVQQIGKGVAHQHGFVMDSKQVAAFKASNARCKYHHSSTAHAVTE
jgi:hypothetical protein